MSSMLNDPMNILFVNNFRGRGGGEEFLRDLLPGLVRKGAKVGLVCRPDTPLTEMLRGTGVDIYPVERSGPGFITSVFRIAKIIRRGGYEIINIQRGHDIIQSWVAAILSGTRPFLIYTSHVSHIIRSRFLLSRMDRITTISRYIAEKTATFVPSVKKRVSILYHGIDLSIFRPEAVKSGLLRKRFGISPDTIIIGTVGDLLKNQIEFLDALADIRRNIPEARYALVGSDIGIGQIQEFRDRAAELDLTGAVLWVGRLSKEEMFSFYADVDIVVGTYRNEGFGIWVLEALAMGKPVVAFNAGGIRDSLEDCPAGALIDGGAKEMAAEIVRIMKDKALLAKMAEAGPHWVAGKFSIDRMVGDYYRFFESVERRP